MTTTRRSTQQRVGRPPAGRGGERVKDYPQVSVRLPPEVKEKLRALVAVRKQPQWQLIVEAVECYLRDLSAPEQRKVEAVLRRLRARGGILLVMIAAAVGAHLVASTRFAQPSTIDAGADLTKVVSAWLSEAFARPERYEIDDAALAAAVDESQSIQPRRSTLVPML